MKKVIIILFISLNFFTSCENIVYLEKINNVSLKNGEYYSIQNNQNGISVRENKIAFFLFFLPRVPQK